MTATRQWPNPADTPLDRRSLIAREYRNALLKLQPEMCAFIDEMVKQFGEDTWLIDGIDTGEDLISRTEAAARAGVAPNTISTWVDRGDITRHPGGYKWSEIDNMLANRRLRRSARRSHELGL